MANINSSCMVFKKSFLLRSPFTGLYIMMLIPVITILALFGKGQIHLFVNAHHSPFYDQFFLFATRLGEPLLMGVIAIALLFFKPRYSLILALSTGVAGGLVAIIKAILIDDMRPFKFFQYFNAPLHFVDGVRLHEYNTFPSGHTALAFSMFFLLSIFVRKTWATAVFFLLAVLVAYSRMYLSLHFLIDVCVGSMIGLLTAAASYHFVHQNPWLKSKEVLDKGIRL